MTYALIVANIKIPTPYQSRYLLEQDTGLEPALTAWKAVVLATDTSPANLLRILSAA